MNQKSFPFKTINNKHEICLFLWKNTAGLASFFQVEPTAEAATLCWELLLMGKPRRTKNYFLIRFLSYRVHFSHVKRCSHTKRVFLWYTFVVSSHSWGHESRMQTPPSNTPSPYSFQTRLKKSFPNVAFSNALAWRCMTYQNAIKRPLLVTYHAVFI